MENLSYRKFKLLENIGKLVKAIDDDVDWFIASIQETDPQRQTLARYMSTMKEKELIQLVKEINEQYK